MQLIVVNGLQFLTASHANKCIQIRSNSCRIVGIPIGLGFIQRMMILQTMLAKPGWNLMIQGTIVCIVLTI